jgi:hypothetical protein
VAGAAGGGIALLAVLVIAIVCLWRRHRSLRLSAIEKRYQGNDGVLPMNRLEHHNLDIVEAMASPSVTVRTYSFPFNRALDLKPSTDTCSRHARQSTPVPSCSEWGQLTDHGKSWKHCGSSGSARSNSRPSGASFTGFRPPTIHPENLRVPREEGSPIILSGRLSVGRIKYVRGENAVASMGSRCQWVNLLFNESMMSRLKVQVHPISLFE